VPSHPVKGYLDLLLLAAITSGREHGYAIAQHLHLASNGIFDLPEGTIYPALHRLERDGLVRSRWSDVDGRKRRAYALTSAGRKELVRRRSDWESFESGVRSILAAATR
jgi:DNA-binding PadR family transcriptional regulator